MTKTSKQLGRAMFLDYFWKGKGEEGKMHDGYVCFGLVLVWLMFLRKLMFFWFTLKFLW